MYGCLFVHLPPRQQLWSPPEQNFIFFILLNCGLFEKGTCHLDSRFWSSANKPHLPGMESHRADESKKNWQHIAVLYWADPPFPNICSAKSKNKIAVKNYKCAADPSALWTMSVLCRFLFVIPSLSEEPLPFKAGFFHQLFLGCSDLGLHTVRLAILWTADKPHLSPL